MGTIEPTELANASDEQLALDAREGNHLAFAELYRRYYPVVRQYVSRRLHCGVSDMVHNVFEAVLSGLRSYRGPRFFSWAYRICVNVVTDELRRQRRRYEVLAEVESDVERVATPEEELIATQLSEQTDRVLAELPEGQRSVFVLARVEGFSYAEIGDLHSIPVGTVKSRIFCAVRALHAVGVTS